MGYRDGRRCRAYLLALLLIASAHFGRNSLLWAQAAGRAACSSSEYHQFDFWVGNWDAFEVTDPKTTEAHLRVEKILSGCVLKETYDGAHGVEGESFSIYDRTAESGTRAG